MAPIRVLVVDDSAVARRLVSEALATDPAIEVAGTAADGRAALARLPSLKPDVVTLDVEMPGLDGIATLVELRKSWPKLPVIMFSAVTERGAAATLEAIARGASDYVTKPVNAVGPADARRRMAEDLIPRVKAFAKVAPPPEQAHLPPPPAPQVPPASKAALLRTHPLRPHAARAEVLAIGVSTGGPNALAELIPALPAGFPIPVVVVQHMPPVFTRLLADRLDQGSQLEVRECQGDELLRPGLVYLARGDFHMRVKGSRTAARLSLDQAPPENSCRPAVDVLFRSVAEIYGAAAISVVLTGMGQDGLKGCQAIRAAGGQILAQDQASSVIWGMPGAIVRAGIADRVLPLGRMAAELVHLAAAGSGALARRANP